MIKIANRQIFILFFDFLKRTWVRRIWATLYKNEEGIKVSARPILFLTCFYLVIFNYGNKNYKIISKGNCRHMNKIQLH